MGVDPAFAELLHDPRNRIRRPPPHVPISAVRAAAKKAMLPRPSPPLASVDAVAAPGPAGPIPIRLYRASSEAPPPLIVFLHGGGFVHGDLDTHDGLCRELALASGCGVASVDYRLAPEAPFPAGLEDCKAAFEWLADSAGALGFDSKRFALCGDSAGGNLALATALAARGMGRSPSALGLFYPLLDPACGSASVRECGEDYLLTPEGLHWFWDLYFGPDADRSDPRAALLGADLHGLPPTILVTAEFDPLRDEGEELAVRLQRAGVDVKSRRYRGMIHGFANMTDLTPVARDAIAFIASGIRRAIPA